MESKIDNSSDHLDDHVDDEIARCLDLDSPCSFFLFAGAGSGKTKSVEKALKTVRVKYGARMQMHGQQAAVITYTTAARDELIRRVEFDPLFAISTIHSFIWELIQGFNDDIRGWIQSNLSEEIAQLEIEQSKGRKGTQAAIDREQKIEAHKSRLEGLKKVSKFTYSPTGEGRGKSALGHSEVIKIGAAFLTDKPLMQRLLISRFPILLIDESQDTNKLLMDAFFAVQASHKDSFCLGLIGDTMQRIYADGKADLGHQLPKDWSSPSKQMNHRCPHRIVKLINKIRSAVDPHLQVSRSDTKEGHVRFFIAPTTADKTACEQAAQRRMAELSGDDNWNHIDQIKVLTLEHHMAALRMGFGDLFAPLDAVEDFRTGLRDGTFPALRFFSDLILPVVQAKLKGNDFAVAAVVREKSPLLSNELLASGEDDQVPFVKAARSAVEALGSLFEADAQPTFASILKSVAQTNLFTIPEALSPFVADDGKLSVDDEKATPEEGQNTKALAALRSFLDTSFFQIKPYKDYMEGLSAFDTHQGVKGLEFARVMVILDDDSARGFLFSYDKLFGAKEKTATDIKNEKAGSETGIDRTRRLFYVTCSRSRECLALIAYSTEPQKVRDKLIQDDWFDETEIEMLI